MTTDLQLFIYTDITLIILLMCLITAGLSLCKEYSVGGMNRLLFANHALVNDYYFDVSDTSYTTVTALDVDDFIQWFEYPVERSLDNFSEVEQITANGKLYIQTLEVTFIKLSPEKRSRLAEILNSKLTAVFRDSNTNWIIMGEEFPIKVIAYKAETGTMEGVSNYKVTFECRSKSPARFIASDYVSYYITGESTPPAPCIDCEDFVAPEVLITNQAVLLSCLEPCPLQ